MEQGQQEVTYDFEQAMEGVFHGIPVKCSDRFDSEYFIRPGIFERGNHYPQDNYDDLVQFSSSLFYKRFKDAS